MEPSFITDPTLLGDAFKQGMRRLAATVTIITLRGEDAHKAVAELVEAIGAIERFLGGQEPSDYEQSSRKRMVEEALRAREE